MFSHVAEYYAVLLPGDNSNHLTSAFVVQVAQGLEHGLPGASSIVDRTIPTFSRGELPHFAGINTFMKAGRARRSRLAVSVDSTILFRDGTSRLD